MDQNTRLSAAGGPAQRVSTSIAPEQFVPDHLFLYILAGELRVYDGSQRLTLRTGDYYLVRKNRLVRYDPASAGADCEMTFFCFEEKFLQSFQAKHQTAAKKTRHSDTFVPINQQEIIPAFIRSLPHYWDASGKIADVFADVKYEELLLILLQNQPELADILFDYGLPGKISLDKFMNRNFTFNVGLPRFAFLTGRSLSAFKRDFQAIFNQTPSRWLVQKRLQEAYFLLAEKNQKPSEIYFDLGFKDLSHFSFAFKNRFGLAPSALIKKKHMK
ncbi:AraC family transcriptional regulator [Hymenobacter sp. PAMC 26628]|uniref:AraC family transcriptional regulator n=1 Tax=Hymenobacter sp. PAMC 26628 TaxID=1484118 RepID=UPI00076FF744|nr:AraC family transcriptional regulator [Hymenobacter sp. PAMC 26628]AMJ67789.1 AraC family transcriptional regulator [Hymenobacter sp. PAMC 26628]